MRKTLWLPILALLAAGQALALGSGDDPLAPLIEREETPAFRRALVSLIMARDSPPGSSRASR